MALIATFALKAGVWFRRGRLLMGSPDSMGTACPLSGRNSTYRPVQILEAGSVHPNQITSWKAQLEGGAADVFGPGGNGAAQPAIDVKSLHAKIGELTLENDFLEGALGKAGLLSAKR